VARVEFEREGVVVEAAAGQNLLQVAERAGVEIFRGMWPELHCGRLKGWCNRCKVWVRPATPGASDAVNAPTASERSRLRINGRVGGAMRLACQVVVSGDVRVHTRAGAPAVVHNPTPAGPSWKNSLSATPEAKEKGDAEEP
jgi:ferredoxin